MRKQSRQFIPRGQSALLAYNNEYQTLGVARPSFNQSTPQNEKSKVAITEAASKNEPTQC